MKIILHNKPSINQKEVQAVSRVLKSGWLAQGSQVAAFENELCGYLGFKPGFSLAFSSGTAALFVALISLGVGENDEVIIPSYLCSAVLNAIYLARAKPRLVDVKPDDFNISFKETRKKINKKTRAIIVPHIFGLPADIAPFLTLKIPVIEDCAQAIGAKLQSKPVGTFGKAAIFSFYASKVIATGYGGMVFSRDKQFLARVKDYREFDCRKRYKPRFNFQLSDIEAALGRVQLRKLPSFLKKREEIARQYYKILPPDKAWPPANSPNKQANFYRFLVRTNKPGELKKFLEARGIKTIIPIATDELLHRYLGKSSRHFPVSERVAKTTLSLPVYPGLTSPEIKTIKAGLKEYA